MIYNMSTLEPARTRREPKFTRGERCIFAHIVTTFILILIILIVYFIHLLVVEHKGNDIFRVSRRQSAIVSESTLGDYRGLGVVYLKMNPVRAACNSLLVQQRWSLAPGHCVAARSEPHLSDLLPTWTIKYRTHSHLYSESRIIRSIAHPHFSIDDLNNNIGLFEHNEFPSIPLFEYPSSTSISLEELVTANIGLISWDLISNPTVMHKDVLVRTTIQGPLKYDECKLYVSPISDLRKHEFCVVVGEENDAVLVHGALLYANSNIVGFFSWGQKQSKEFPIVILNITSFKEWLDYITS